MKTLFTALALLCALPLSAQLPPVFPEQMSDTLEHDTRMRTYLPPVRIVWTQNGEFVQTPEVLLAKGKGQMINAPYPHCILTNKDGKRPSILLDFGREIHGGVQIVVGDISNRKPVQFRMRLGESVSEAMSDISVESGATNDHAMRDLIVSVPWYGVSEVGNSGFRFVRLDLLTEDVVVKLQEVRAIFVYRDLPYLGSFHSSNPRLDSIWMTGAYTVHLNMQNYLWDGIKRDRLVWMGDAHPELRTILSVFGDNEVLRKTFDQARDQTPLPGWMNGICAYSLWWILIHRDYYNYTGDRAYLTEQQQYLEGLLSQVIESVDEQGREHHGQNAGGEEDLIGVVADEFESEGRLGQNEGEFPHLCKAEGRKQRRAQGISQHKHGGDGHEYLGRDDPRRAQGDDGQVGEEEVHVEQHPHGNEEDAGKDFLEGHDAFQRVEAVLRLRHHETGQKRPQRQGKPQP